MVDAAACIEAGKCTVITNTQYAIFIGIFVVAAILLIVLFMVGFFTPAIIFLKAKFKKSSLIYAVNRGQVGQFMIASGKHQGIADVKGVGPFIITENSHTIEKKSKTPMYFAFGEFAATLPLEYSLSIQLLRESGEKITNIEDLAKKVGLKFNDETKVWETDPDADPEEGETEVEITPYKTIKLHDLAYMFPFNITPALIESKTQHMIGLKMGMFNKMNMQYVMMFIMIMMGVTLAAVIAFKFLKSGDTTATHTIVERVVQEVPMIQNMTG